MTIELSEKQLDEIRTMFYHAYRCGIRVGQTLTEPANTKNISQLNRQWELYSHLSDKIFMKFEDTLEDLTGLTAKQIDEIAQKYDKKCDKKSQL